jgi:hypothetical protein
MRALARWLSIAIAFSVLPLAAGGGKRDPLSAFKPAETVFLRKAYDTDPTVHLGRFIKAGTATADIDESSTFVTECSAYVKPKVVDAGEVFYEEFFNASAAARLSAGIQKVASLSAEAGASSTMKARYTLYKVMQGEVTDPAGFTACCAKGPEMCSDRYVAEFLMGTGATYVGALKDKKLKVDTTPGTAIPGLDPAVFPLVEVGADMAWFRGTTFNKPVYFAFKTAQTNGPSDFEACGSWTSVVPRSGSGQFFVGIAPDADGEATGRELALDNAREQVVKFLGEQITTGSLKVNQLSGSGAGVASTLTMQASTARAATGVAAFVKDRAWCVQPVTNAKGNFTSVKVLTYIPNESLAAAAEAAATSAGVQ